MVDHIPIEPFDKNVEKIITEKGTMVKMGLYRQIKLTRLFFLIIIKYVNVFLL